MPKKCLPQNRLSYKTLLAKKPEEWLDDVWNNYLNCTIGYVTEYVMLLDESVKAESVTYPKRLERLFNRTQEMAYTAKENHYAAHGDDIEKGKKHWDKLKDRQGIYPEDPDFVLEESEKKRKKLDLLSRKLRAQSDLGDAEVRKTIDNLDADLAAEIEEERNRRRKNFTKCDLREDVKIEKEAARCSQIRFIGKTENGEYGEDSESSVFPKNIVLSCQDQGSFDWDKHRADSWFGWERQEAQRHYELKKAKFPKCQQIGCDYVELMNDRLKFRKRWKCWNVDRPEIWRGMFAGAELSPDNMLHYDLDKKLNEIVNMPASSSDADKQNAIEIFVNSHHHGGSVFDFACPTPDWELDSQTTSVNVDQVILDALDCMYGVDWES